MKFSSRTRLSTPIVAAASFIGVATHAAARFMINLRSPAARIAVDQDEQVEVSAQLEMCGLVPASVADDLRNIAAQLVRNTVSHGIEPPHERAVASKPAVGGIGIACRENAEGGFDFICRDDGRGLVPVHRVFDKLRACGGGAAGRRGVDVDPTVVRAPVDWWVARGGCVISMMGRTR